MLSHFEHKLLWIHLIATAFQMHCSDSHESQSVDKCSSLQVHFYCGSLWTCVSCTEHLDRAPHRKNRSELLLTTRLLTGFIPDMHFEGIHVQYANC